MLVKDFYKIDGKEAQEDGSVVYSVSLNTTHDVYKGHFPERPITPGVCNIQMIKELAEDSCSRSLTLTSIDRCRLTAMVTPNESPVLNVKVQWDAADSNKLAATIYYGDITYMTLSGTVADRLA
ncbi:MAG: beta-hydroxyacyl-ACP dehydratase [Bacteroidales bacterium]|jgi:3-hydroxyacyl-[acyl-carrier-protein] dehydratase|nr:beta-hydroxyacyl-ACP dehydratase [Bacteroidales bacterium]